MVVFFLSGGGGVEPFLYLPNVNSYEASGYKIQIIMFGDRLQGIKEERATGCHGRMRYHEYRCEGM